jgi:hypothetical protein
MSALPLPCALANISPLEKKKESHELVCLKKKTKPITVCMPGASRVAG